jgi:hypothetical protein
MNVKDEQKPLPATSAEPTPPAVLLLLTAATLLGTVLGNLLALGWMQMQGLDAQTALYSLDENSPRSLRDAIRMANLLNHLSTFTIPALLVGLLMYRGNWLRALKLNFVPPAVLLLPALLFVMASFPFTQLTYWFNQQLPLPDWMRAMEDATEQMVKGLLVMNAPAELGFNLLIIGVVPAIGEELVFRGILQPQLQRLVRCPVAAIWLTAILFSAIHLQFAGFLPRVVLGAALGYIFYWTRSLWVPILAHFITNAMQVITQYMTNGKLTENELEHLKTSDWIMGILSFAVTFALGYYLWKRANERPSDTLQINDHKNA